MRSMLTQWACGAGNSRGEESSIAEALGIVSYVEPGGAKRLLQLGGGEQTELVHFVCAASPRPIGDLVVENESGEAAIDLDATDAGHADPIRLAGVSRHARRVEGVGRIPGLDDDHPAGFQMFTKADQRAGHQVERL